MKTPIRTRKFLQNLLNQEGPRGLGLTLKEFAYLVLYFRLDRNDIETVTCNRGFEALGQLFNSSRAHIRQKVAGACGKLRAYGFTIEIPDREGDGHGS